MLPMRFFSFLPHSFINYSTMADINPLRSPYLTCSNEMRRLVIRGSTELNQSNSFIADLFKISTRTVQRILDKFHLTRWFLRITLAGRKVIFIDEVGFNLSMRVSQGRSPARKNTGIPTRSCACYCLLSPHIH